MCLDFVGQLRFVFLRLSCVFSHTLEYHSRSDNAECRIMPRWCLAVAQLGWDL
jgi:hypothetical protein